MKKGETATFPPFPYPGPPELPGPAQPDLTFNETRTPGHGKAARLPNRPGVRGRLHAFRGRVIGAAPASSRSRQTVPASCRQAKKPWRRPLPTLPHQFPVQRHVTIRHAPVGEVEHGAAARFDEAAAQIGVKEAENSGFKTLIATKRPSVRSFALYTSDIPPAPIFPMIS